MLSTDARLMRKTSSCNVEFVPPFTKASRSVVEVLAGAIAAESGDEVGDFWGVISDVTADPAPHADIKDNNTKV